MNRLMPFVLCFVLGISFVSPAPAPGQDQGNPEEAIKLAKKLTDTGAATFNTADAKAMGAYYTEDAKIFLQLRNDEGVSVKEYDGRAAIEEFYADLFKDPGRVHAKNTVDYARLLAPDILVIAGMIVPNLDDPEPLKVPFYQVRIKKEDKWLIHSLRIFYVPAKK